VAEQVEVLAPAGAKVHGLPPNAPLAPPLENVTVPAGDDLLPASSSLTVAVQVVLWFTTTVPGTQVTVVCVSRLVTLNGKASCEVSCRAEPA
jgi:hypothetical protein